MSSPLIRQFPYEPRDNQKEIIQEIDKCLERGKSLAYQAATGSGKTICGLTPVLRFAEKNGKKVLYLTRTNSQQRQVLLEMRELGGHYGLGVQGRNNTCLLAEEDEELSEGNAEELSKYCSDRKKEVRSALEEGREPTSCPYYGGMLECDLKNIKSWTKKNLPTVDEFMNFCRENELCAYELSKALIPEAELVTAPYIYFFLPFIRRRMLEWMEVDLSDLIVIIDEAHNLPDYARDLASSEVSQNTLQRAITESEEFGDPSLNEGSSISSFCRLFEDILLDTVEEFVVDEDGLIPPNEVRSELLHFLGINTTQLNGIIKDLKVQGEIVQEERREEKKLPRSYIHSFASFLTFWLSMDGEEYVKLVNERDTPSLEGYCLDPSNITEILNECHSSIHQSATLEPLDEYRDSIGLPYDTETKTYPSPFPEENKIDFYIDEVTTKYDVLKKEKGMKEKIRDELKDILKDVDRNTVVFFPSYRLMDQIIGPLDIDGLYRERRDMDQVELMDMIAGFKEDGGVLVSVIGGRISEGMDFPGKELEVAVVVGIPYPKPTARQKALQHYYNLKFDAGWHYTVEAPAVRKILQATGRLVRSETDKGASLIMDKRTVHFQKYLEGLELVEEPGERIEEFFER